MPSEGYLTNLTIKQESGTAAAFTAELLDSVIPYPVGETASGTAAVDAVEFYRIVPQQTATAGNTSQILASTQGYPYLNMDGDPTNNQRFLYLLINPTAAAGTTIWKVTVTVHNNYGV